MQKPSSRCTSRELQARKLRGPAAGGIEQFQQRPVAPPTGIGPARGGEQPVDLLGAEHLRHALPELLAAQQLGQVVGQHAFQLQVAEEDLQRDDVPGDAGRGQLPAVQPADVVGQVADRQLRNARGARASRRSAPGRGGRPPPCFRPGGTRRPHRPRRPPARSLPSGPGLGRLRRRSSRRRSGSHVSLRFGWKNGQSPADLPPPAPACPAAPQGPLSFDYNPVSFDR